MSKIQNVVLIDVVPPVMTPEETEDHLSEVVSLVKTYGKANIVKIIQRRAQPHPGTYIGSGKADEVAAMIKPQRIDVVILNALAKSSQVYKLQKLFWEKNPNIEVWDRVDLILHIFEKHARTAEAKLQIELARMRHMGPRMYGLGTELGRQGGGIGTRGLGETNIELMKRHWRQEMKKTQEKLTKQEKTKTNQMDRRREQGFQTVAIVGYTNAGKTTLFNKLTGKDKLSKDVLFATLDSSIGKLAHSDKPILVADTIGFIQNLPASLIDAFKSTLLESTHADLLLHVIDISDPKMYDKIQTVEKILAELGLAEKKKVYVFNKRDLLQNPQRIDELKREFTEFSPQFISVQEDENVTQLNDVMKANTYW
ncbi:MAG: GTPase HflX [Weeksellaceae bacterium]